MLIEEIAQLDEVFYMNYDMFGWIEPSGKVHLATPKQAASKKDYFHYEMIRDLKVGGMDKALRRGWVRWFCDDNALYMETQSENPSVIATIQKGVKSIEKLATKPSKLKHFMGSDSPIIIASYHVDGPTFDISSPNFNRLINLLKQKMGED